MSKTNRGFEILNITVDVGGGKQDKIIVYENDEPNMVARDFALKHRLNQNLEIALSRNIYDLICDINKEQLYLSQSFSSKSEHSITDCKNYGEKMYAKGLRHKEQVEANKQLLKMQLEKKVAQSTSFHPVISQKSKKLAKNAQTRTASDFHQVAQKSEEEFTFKPKINEKSLQLVGRSNNRIQELYEDARQKKQRIEDLNVHARKHEFPFKPNVGKSVIEHTDTDELVNRLMNSKNNYEESIEELRKKYEVTKDPETGQEFFKPNIGKNYKIERTTENIWEALYKHQKRPMESLAEYPYAPVRMDSKAKTEKILLKVKIDRYSEVFHMLNPDVNGMISYKNINFQDVDQGIYKIIEPLLDELNELDQPLNFEEFVDAMERLMKTLSQPERDVFLTKKKKSEETEENLKKTLSGGEFSVYKRNVEKKNKVGEKLEIEREKNKILELEGCTFRPQTTRFPIEIFNK